MKEGDVGTPIYISVVDKKGVVVNLTTASKVYLVMLLGGVRAEKECTVLDATAGRVKYVIAEGDLHTNGRMDMETRVEFQDGRIFTSGKFSEDIDVKI